MGMIKGQNNLAAIPLVYELCYIQMHGGGGVGDIYQLN